VALIALLAFMEALRPRGARPLVLALFLGMAVWARMDAALYCIPAALVFAERCLRARAGRDFLLAVVVALGLIAALFVLRFVYFTEWLPNTYYLKATHWPLAMRLPRGIGQNVVAVVACLVGLPPLAWVLLRRASPARVAIGAALLTHAAVVTYSTCLGGDFSFESFGYDRFTCVSAVFLMLGLVAFVSVTPLSSLARGSFACWSLGVLVLPVMLRPPTLFSLERPLDIFTMRAIPWQEFMSRGELHPVDNFAQLFVYYGKISARVTLPSARIAVCGAGATIYFSHRGGVDLLGKMDPQIARLPATNAPPPERRCWQGHAGHNKESLSLSFATHAPDLSLVAPPKVAEPTYVAFKYGYIDMWARVGSPYIRWDVVQRHQL